MTGEKVAGRPARKLARAMLLSGCAVWLLCAAPATAKPARFDIPAQDLATALNQFGVQSGREVLYTSDILTAKRSARVQGELEPDTALRVLLAGTGLSYRETNGRIQILSGDAASPKRAGAELAPTTQTAQSGSAAGAVYEQRAEEIVVTAQKRRERLIEVPQSVSVLSASDLAKLNATQFRDFADTIPGLSFQTAGPGFTLISLRGVTVGLDPSATVGLYVDDVPYGSSTSFARGGYITLDAGLFDLDRVEVLRRPQGTLYGASAMGGLLKYVTKQPDMNNFSGSLQAGVASTHDGGVSYNVAAEVNAPIVADKAAARVSGFENHGGGYIDNVALGQKDVNSSDIYGGRIDLAFAPTDRLDIRLTGFLQNTSTDGSPLADFTLAGVPVSGTLAQRRLFPETFDQEFRLVSGTVSYDFGPAKLTSISSYQTTQTKLFYDFSSVVAPLLGLGAVAVDDKTTTNKFTQEVRLASAQGQVLEWLIGGFYTHETSEQHEVLNARDRNGQSVPNTFLTLTVPSRYAEYAVFGDLTWHLTDKFDVTGGVRYARNRQTLEQIGTGILIKSAPAIDSDSGDVTYLANARYRFSDHVTAYLRYATGYRPGGPNVVVNNLTTGLPIGATSFNADRIHSYEGGLKAETTDGRFGIDLSGYNIDWTNMQISVTQNGFSVRANAPSGATVRGAELTLTARPASEFTVTGAFAYQDAHLNGAEPALGAAAGERLPNVPRFTATLNADYELPIDSFRPTVGATLRHVGERRASFDKSTSFPQYRLPAYTSVDLRAGFMLGVTNDHPVNVQFYVHNLFDEHGQLIPRLVFFPPATGPAQISITQPRTIGVSASMKF
jgi:outer membrane receptor protein involved in Fe transport